MSVPGRSWLARFLGVVAAPVVLAGVIAGVAPVASAAPLWHRLATTSPAAVPASLQAAVRSSLGTPASAGGYSQQAELTGSPASGDGVGWSVALSGSGTTALVGAPGRNSLAGAAYVFTLRGRSWSRTAELTGSGTPASDQFGHSVALSGSGTTALVGAPGHNSFAGAAYAFTLRSGSWSRTAELTGSDTAAVDGFGFSVALSGSGTTALAGAPGHSTSAGTAAGAAYVFTLRGRSWSQAAELTGSDTAAYDAFGSSVALAASGRIALAGAIYHNSDAGAAYVFAGWGRAWSQAAELTAADAASGDNLGWSVALSASGNTALAGAPRRDSAAGAAYVFTR